MEAAARGRVGEFDLVHVTAIWQRTGPAACRAAQSSGVPYVISPRGALGPYSWRRGTLKKLTYYFLYERRNLRKAAGFHYTSAMEAAECERFRFGKPSCVVPNGIDFQKWRRDEQAGGVWRAANGVAPNALVLLYAGRLHHKKGLDLLPPVLEQLSDLPWRMVFVGNDEDGTREKLQDEFQRRGLQERVVFLEKVVAAELVAAYSGSNLFLLPSRHENFGNVAVEAAACGCWVLASEHTAVVHELTVLGAGKRLPRRTAAWAGAIKVYYTTKSRQSDPQVLPRLKARIDIAGTAAAMQDFYGQVMQSLDNPGTMRDASAK
jgi:glycosyltransferase involved in cell wall biosynthesis